MMNPKYVESCIAGLKLQSKIVRSEEFYNNYREEIINKHKELSMDLQQCSWPAFSVKKIKLFPGETIQDLLLANAIALAKNDKEIIEIYHQLSSKKISLASPFFNNLRKKGTRNLASCFILEVEDSLDSIMKTATYCAKISKAGGGCGCSVSKIRAKGSDVAGNKGAASSIMNWVRIIDQVCVSVNQLGVRPGAITVALDIWHSDIEEFLDCQTENGDLRAKAYNIQPQVVIWPEFMEAVIDNTEYSLFCPKDLADNNIEVSTRYNWYIIANKLGLARKTIKARELWKKIQEQQMTVGRPYIFFIDNAQNNSPFQNDIKSANLCVAGETLLLTKAGYVRIDSVAGTLQEVWNGMEWSLSPVFKTSENQELLKITFSNGAVIEATEYHKWNIANYKNKKSIKTTAELKPGDKIPKTKFPVITGNKSLKHAYTHGLFSADGHYSSNDYANINLYGKKIELLPFLALRKEPGQIEKNVYGTGVDRLRVLLAESICDKTFIPDCTYDLESRISWLEGLFDGDGTVNRQQNGICSLQLTSTDLEFLDRLVLELTTLGVRPTISSLMLGNSRSLPGAKPTAVYKSSKRICINSSDLLHLISLGFSPKRLDVYSPVLPSQNKAAFITIKSVEKTGRFDETFCLTEPLLNTVIFNGIESRNCTESYSYFKADEYIHSCNLISVNLSVHENLETIAESASWATILADRSLDISKIDIPEVVNHVRDFRTIGVGLMGLADWLAFNKTFYSDTLFIEETAKTVALACYKTSVELAAELGACGAYETLQSDFWERMDVLLPETAKLRADTGIRNSMMTCTAPNTSTSLTMGSTASFLPPYQKQFFDESEDNTLDVVVKYAPDLYLTNFQMNQSFILNAAQAIQKWTDAGISMEFLFPKGASWSDNKAVSDLKIQSWKLGAKAIYYVRTAEPDEESICQMCAN